MRQYTSYSVKIKHYNHILRDTLDVYRRAVDFYISVCLAEWDVIDKIGYTNSKYNYLEQLSHSTKNNPTPKYDFDAKFYKFPSYLRRAAITHALGCVSSHKSNGEKGAPKAGYCFPVLYRDNSFVLTGTYTARIKVYIRNTWDWLDVELRKSDVDYIQRRCSGRKELCPTLRKSGKQWFLDFAFEENVQLCNKPVQDRTIVSVDLGVTNACTCSVMTAKGTILARKFLSLAREQDSLYHVLNKIRQAQQHGAKRTPRLWARANGLSDDIAVKTAAFIMDIATGYHADVIVFEALNTRGRKRFMKQRLHHWRAQYVQAMVTTKAHRLGMRISRVCAAGTSKYAFDGSGEITRGINGNYSLCKFQTGKIYNCDLSASYNIGARYFVREIYKSLPETAKSRIAAKVPECAKRTTCTLATLISLVAELAA
jgi:IS605 OrfB family transposase